MKIILPWLTGAGTGVAVLDRGDSISLETEPPPIVAESTGVLERLSVLFPPAPPLAVGKTFTKSFGNHPICFFCPLA